MSFDRKQSDASATRREPRQRRLAGRGRGRAGGPTPGSIHRRAAGLPSPRPRPARAPLSTAARRATSAKLAGGHRFVSHRAPTLSTSLGPFTPAITLRAHRRSSSDIATTNLGLVDVRPERLGEPHQPIDRMYSDTPRRHAMRIEMPRPLARLGHPDPPPRPAGPRHQARSEEALQVDDEVEPPPPQPRQESRESPQSRAARALRAPRSNGMTSSRPDARRRAPAAPR